MDINNNIIHILLSLLSVQNTTSQQLLLLFSVWPSLFWELSAFWDLWGKERTISINLLECFMHLLVRQQGSGHVVISASQKFVHNLLISIFTLFSLFNYLEVLNTKDGIMQWWSFAQIWHYFQLASRGKVYQEAFPKISKKRNNSI